MKRKMRLEFSGGNHLENMQKSGILMAELHLGRLVFWGCITLMRTPKRVMKWFLFPNDGDENDEKQENVSWCVARTLQAGANGASPAPSLLN